ncbi:MAG TPA: hypothetical protein VF629_10825 [Hymenobacter sp.]|jgi:hypothetical protein|uniref:hypothetical protein n=1 Tax=Hymenobacter sp. TaxID=1898978 RepID=UPI002ED930B9
MEPQQELTGVISDFAQALAASFDPDQAAHAVISLVREVDVTNESLSGVPVTDIISQEGLDAAARFFKFGFPFALRAVYPAVQQLATHYYSPASANETEWAQEVIYKSGKAAICAQLTDGIPAGLVRLTKPSDKEFLFRYSHAKCGIEYFDEIDASFVRRHLTKQMLEEAELLSLKVSANIERIMAESLSNPDGVFISYNIPGSVWATFVRQAPYQVVLMQGHDDFGQDEVFGGVCYGQYCQAVEYLIATALMHTHFCTMLGRRNPEVDAGVILTRVDEKQHVIEELGNYLGTTPKVAEQVLSCLCMTPDNSESYLSEPGAPPPPYIQISNNQLVRSAAGCMINPFCFLNKSLKAKFRKDYDKLVNEREARFMNDVYSLFEGERFITVNRTVDISSDKGNTDLDAVVFDTQTKTLALFQLKWQDPLGESIKLRRTKADNLFKANDWVDRVCSWLKSKSGPEILQHVLKTNGASRKKELKELKDVCLFVVGRHNMHFSNREMDNRAVWASWQGICAAQIQIAAFVQDDPIWALYARLRIQEADGRISRDDVPPTEYDMQLGSYTIRHTSA